MIAEGGCPGQPAQGAALPAAATALSTASLVEGALPAGSDPANALLARPCKPHALFVSVSVFSKIQEWTHSCQRCKGHHPTHV